MKIQQTNETPIKALIFLDSGASGNYIAEPFLRRHNIQKQPKKNPYTLRSLDGKPIGKDGQITHKTVPLTLTAHEHSEQIKLEPTPITRYDIILGIPWLNKHDPDIRYRTGQISFKRCPPTCKLSPQMIAALTRNKENLRNVPSIYHDFEDLFSKQKADRLPEHKPYDHAIRLQPGFQLPYKPIYSQSATELKALREYLEENLKKGFI